MTPGLTHTYSPCPTLRSLLRVLSAALFFVSSLSVAWAMPDHTPRGTTAASESAAPAEGYMPPQSFIVPGPNKRVDFIYRGLNRLLPARVLIPDADNVERVYMEVVYKGKLPSTSLHKAIQAKLSTGEEVTLTPKLIKGNWGQDGVAVFFAEVGPTSRVQLDFEVEENSAQSLLLYVLRDTPSSSYQAGVYASVYGYSETKSFDIPVPKDTRTRDITVTLPITEITTDGRVLDFVITAGDREIGFRRQWNNNYPFRNECCIDTVQATLRGVTGSFDKVTVKVISPSGSSRPSGQSYVLSGLLQVEVSPVCAALEVQLPSDVCTQNVTVMRSVSPGKGYTATWDYGEGAMPRQGTGFGTQYLEYGQAGTQTIAVEVKGPDCVSRETFSVQVGECVTSSCALQGVSVIQHPAPGKTDGILELDMCVSCGSKAPYTISYRYLGQTVRVENVNEVRPRLTGLSDGTYDQITVTDANGCRTNVTGPITLCTGGCGKAPVCPDQTCTLTGITEGKFHRTFWLPEINPANPRWQWESGTGQFTVTGDRSAVITGRIMSLADPKCGLEVNMVLRERRTWTEWSGLGRMWKGSAERDKANQHTTWDYYELVPEVSTLKGFGCYAGTLQLSPKPANYSKGFQVGEAANDKTLAPGISGWFAFKGQLNGKAVSGEGDINAEGTCRFQDLTRNAAPIISCAPDFAVGCGKSANDAPKPTINCGNANAYKLTSVDREVSKRPRKIERTWTATGPGGPATCVQVLTFGDDGPPVFTKVPTSGKMMCGEVAEQTAEATDGCGGVTMDYKETRFNERCAGNYDLRRVWTATDESGNTATVEAIINVVDETAPTFVAPPADIILECKDPLPTDAPGATDDCGGNVKIDYEVSQCLSATPIYSWQAGDLVYLTEGLDPKLKYPSTVIDLTLTSVCSDLPGQRKRWRVTNPNSFPVFVKRVEAYGKRVYGGLIVPANTQVFFFTLNESGANTTKIYWDDASGSEKQSTKSAGNETCTLTPAETCTCLIVRKWTAKDACGNVSTYEQKIWQRDSKAPTLRNVPADRTYTSLVEVPAAGGVTATDGCTKATVSLQEYKIPSDDSDCDEAAIYYLTGAKSDGLPLLTLGDRNFVIGAEPLKLRTYCNGTAKVFGIVADATNRNAKFAVEINLAQRRTYAQHTAAGGKTPDNCASADKAKWLFYEIEPNGSELVGQDGLAGTVLTITGASNHVLQIGPGANRTNCKLGVAGDLGYTTKSGSFPGTAGQLRTAYFDVGLTQKATCAGNLTIVRVYSAEDECGNRTFLRQVIRVTDETKPTIAGIPENLTLNCGDAIPRANVTASDSDGSKVEVVLDEKSTGSTCDRRIVRTWTATDACGNAVTGRQTITVQDKQAPTIVFNLPALQGKTNGDLLVVSCSNVPQLDRNTVKVSDNCDNAPKLDFEQESITKGDCASNGFSERLKYTWTATDSCNNKTVIGIFVEFHDDEKPTFTEVPAAVTASCGDGLPTTKPSAKDNCGPAPTVVETSRRTNGTCADSYTITRIWTATDACGNTASATQAVTFSDRKAPVITGVPQSVTLSCAAAFPTTQPKVSDDCDKDVSLTEAKVTQAGGCASGYSVVRTWTATDNCGNTATASQTITVEDKEAPTITFTNAKLKGFTDGQELVVDCGSEPTFSKDDVTAGDKCDSKVEVRFAQQATAQTGCDAEGFVKHITATWTAVDACGNSTSISVKLKVRDNQKPTLTSVPGDITIACGQALPTSKPVAQDNCTPAADLKIDETSVRKDGACADGYTITRTWKTVDACGNSASAKQVITVEDKLRPVLAGIPASVTLSCEEPLPTTLPTASDNCDKDVKVTFADTKVAGACASGQTITRVFTATDNCGNTATASQVITVRDQTAPTLAQVPANVTVSCSGVLPKGEPIASDNCGAKPVLTVVETKRPGNCPDRFDVVRTWTATDACGNTATASQVITVTDDVAPKFGTLPQNVQVSCDAPLPTTKPSATDDCDKEVNVGVTQTTRAGACANGYEIVRLFTATDNCGNSITATQVVTVSDTKKPVFAIVPKDVTIGCTAAVPQDRPSATDNCDGQVEVKETQTREVGSCAGRYKLIRTFTAVDKCGNQAVATQVVTVDDTDAPVFSYVPANIELVCNEALPKEQPTVSDVCDAKVTVAEVQTRRAEKCAGTYELVRTWTATDHCGNMATASQVIKVTDQTAPVFAAVPANVTIDCDAALPTTAPTATDNCDGSAKILLVETRKDGSCEDGYQVVRTWTATDACGNAATTQQVVTVRDTKAPVFAGVPASIDISCDGVLPLSEPTASDNCDKQVSIAETTRREPGTCTDSYRLIRVWTATDNCGNSATASQVVTITDKVAPVFAGVPAAVTISCDATLPSASPKVTDNCDNDLAINETQSRKPGLCPEAYEIVRLWTATDNCGNTATVSQVVTVTDDQKPVFAFVPAPVTLVCDAALPNTQPEVSDNCDQNVEIKESRESKAGDCPGNSTLIRTWTAVDNCGNTATASQVVTLVDNKAPVFANVPQATSISCEGTLPTSQPIATDNCDQKPAITESAKTTPGTCPGNYSVTRVWTATDACGNTATASQVVTVTDTKKPTFTDVPAALTLSCEESLPTVLAKATDNCDTDVAVTETQARREGNCGGGYTVVRTFVATDDCGNTASAQQIVTFRDQKAPVFAGIPAAITLQCSAALPTDEPTATDNCDKSVDIVETQATQPGTCENNYRVVRTWTATDDCGNTATAIQVVTLEDTIAPTFVSVPKEATVECSDALPKDYAAASDNCDRDVAVTVTERRENGTCTDSYVIYRVFTATDNCGNTATVSQKVNVRDTKAPTFLSVPPAVTIACDAPLPIKLASATDNCDQQVEVTETQIRIDGTCAHTYQIVRTFTASDNCGNTASISQVVTVTDAKAPVFVGVPAGVSITCAEPLPVDAPVATDNCDTQVNVVETQRTEPGTCAGTFAVIRIWTATDACGNSATASQRVQRTDKQAPTFASVPGDVTIACEQPLPTDLPVATDDCDAKPVVTETQRTEPGTCVGSYRVIRTFKATDACGNVATAQQIVQVEDKRAPVIAKVPGAVTIACDAPLPTDAPVAADNCDANVSIVESQEFLRSACAGNYRIVRMWTASDACGNTATATQLVTVQDLTPPVFASVPAAASISCDAALPTALPTASDNCDQAPHVSETQSRLPGGCADSYTLIRLFTATDACGNTATASQQVTVSDKTAPKLVGVPSNVVASCDEDVPTDKPTATDNCDSAVDVTEATETIPGTCKGSYVLVRTWTATDNCGNTATASQRVEVGDRSEPSFTSVPAAISLNCGDALPTDQPTASDNCDGNVGIVETSARVTGNCADSYRVIRTWTATDGCGNKATASQVVTYEDKVAPVFANVPPAIAISCEQALPTTQPRATDDCATTVTLTERAERKKGQCEDGYTITRIWTATDNCGNSATASQVVTIQDKTAPAFAQVPASVTIACSGDMPDAEASATDNCDTQVKVTKRDTRKAGACEDSYTIVREWTAVDNCGNTATASQVITVIDAKSPVFASVPPAVSVSCSQGLPTSTPNATDECDKRVDIAETQETLQGPCPDSYTVIRTWTATDNCGNTARVSQTVTVSDDSAPRFTKVPASRTIDCDQDPGDDEPVATDDCDKDVAITMTETSGGTDCKSGITLTRIWTATDNCGNTATASQTIKFEDTEKPVFGKLERTLTVECDQPIPTIYPTVTDKCDRDVNVAFFDKRDEKPCGAIVTRTWVATDDCGNTASATQLVVIKDSQLPILTGVPATTQIACGEALPIVNVTATDNCAPSLPVVYEQLEVPGRCAGERIIYRVWTATDACGNAAVGSQEVVVTDGSAPTLANVPVSVELSCGTALPTTKPTATDNCGGDAPTITSEDKTEPGICASSYRIVRVWTATDKCGNATTASQVITFRDAVAPVLSQVPAAATIVCGQALPTAKPTATDNCDTAPEVKLTEETIAGSCASNYEVIRTWTASDKCGNTSTATQRITVSDTQAPTFIALPQNVSLDCNEPVPSVQPVVTDNCDTKPEFFMAEQRTETETGYVLTRLWTASDACGNAATASQVITVKAGGSPSFTFVPDDLTLTCGATVPSAEALASDACGSPVDVTVEEKRKDGKCVGSYVLTRTWTARSSNGKSAKTSQTITVADDAPPVFTKVPTSVTLACGVALPTDLPEAADQCGGRVRVTVDEDRKSGSCPNNRSVVRTFTASDDCGNKATATQVITYADQEAPTFTYVPSSEEFQCSVGQPKDKARATDNCSKNVAVTYVDVTPSTDCSQRLQRVWTATDECGNTATAVQQILLQDTERPSLANVPSNVAVDLTKGDKLPAAAKVVATDNCDASPQVKLSEQTVPGSGCNYVIVRTWEAIDRCGNTARGTQRVSVTDQGSASIAVEETTDCAPAFYNVRSVTQPTGATYQWTSSRGSFGDASAAETRFIPEGAGDYTLQLRVIAQSCSGTASATVNVGGTALQVTGNGPICVGEELKLIATAGAKTYAWTGPNGFKSSEQSPWLPNATPAMSGEYRLIADFGDCRQNASVTVVVSDQLAVDLKLPEQVCGGSPFTLTATGAYSGVWTAPGGTTYSGATVVIPAAEFAAHAGQWSVTAGNASGCKTTKTFTLSVIRPPVTTGIANSPLCAAGTLELSASGARTYAWTGPNSFSASGERVSIENLDYSAGTYAFYVVGTNTNGCSSRDTVEVTVTGAASVVATAPDSLCIGAALRLEASGATEYFWTGPNGFASQEATASVGEFSAAKSGTYDLVAQTSGGCTIKRSFTVTARKVCGDDPGTPGNPGTPTCTLPSLTSVQTTDSECGRASGSITIPVTRPQDYVWKWLPAIDALNTASQLAAGDYVIDVRLNSDSSCTQTYRVTLAGTGGFTVASKAAAAGCDTLGSATLLPSKASTYRVTWSDLSVATDQLTRTGLAAGEYAFTITDLSGCSQTGKITVTNSCACEASASVIRAEKASVCLTGATQIGLVKVTEAKIPAGHTERFILVDASAGQIIRTAAAPIFMVSETGVYGLHQLIYREADVPAAMLAPGANVKALENFLTQRSASICAAFTAFGARVTTAICCTEPDLAAWSTTDANCGLADGRAQLRLTNPQPGDVFRWTPAAGRAINPEKTAWADLPSGTYRVEVIRADTTCRRVIELTIGNSAIAIAPPSIAPATCGSSDGKASFSGSLKDYTFAWSDGATTADRTDLAAGTYTVTVSAKGTRCSEVFAVVVQAAANFSASATVLSAPGCGEANGQVRIDVEGGSGNFSFDWGGGATRTDLAAGRYLVQVTDRETSCTNLLTFVLEGAAPGKATVTVKDLALACFGESDGKVDYKVTYGTAFRLPPTITIVDAQNRPAKQGELGPGSYCILVRDGESCLAGSACFEVTAPQQLSVTVTSRAKTCVQGGSLSVVPSGGRAPYSYDWAHLPNANNPASIAELAPGTYSVTVRDANGCTNVLTALSVGDSCTTTPPAIATMTTDTVRVRVVELTAEEVCFVFEPLFPRSNVVCLLGAGGTTGRSAFGSWSLTQAGCLSYVSGSTIGTGLDTITVIATSGPVADTTVYFIDIVRGGDGGPRVITTDTTLLREVRVGFTGQDCFADLGLGLSGQVTTVRDLCTTTPNVGRADLTFFVDTQCFGYLGLLPGVDTLCLEVCTALGCDTLNLVVSVLAPKPATITRQLAVGETGQLCLDTSEISSPFTESFNFCEAESGRVVGFEFNTDSLCVTYTGLAIGSERACYVVCNAFTCDTTFVEVTVNPTVANAPPVAVDDNGVTAINTPVTIDVLLNDTINGTLVNILSQTLPSNGNLFIESEGVFRYTPNRGFCGRVDSFTYTITNGIAFDTATVRIQVTCDELVIFSGFSPNGDGVNDDFRVLGIEEFPDNRFIVFNRWGNEVFNQRGYDNSLAKAFTGRWNGKDLPDGTYFYVLDLGNGDARSGYLQIAR